MHRQLLLTIFQPQINYNIQNKVFINETGAAAQSMAKNDAGHECCGTCCRSSHLGHLILMSIVGVELYLFINIVSDFVLLPKLFFIY